MSEKRRDIKNRILQNGESQRADGRYAYVYVDGNGKQKFLYSWKLVDTDRAPLGKRDCESLRSKIKKLKKDMEDGIRSGGEKMTVLELCKKYLGQRRGDRYSTTVSHNNIVRILETDSFGARYIDKIKISDAKSWFLKLQEKDEKGYSLIRSIRGVIKPAFQMAVDDDLIRKNPFDFSLATTVVNDSKQRDAITEEQEEEFLNFIKTDKHFCRYYDPIYILFKTGLRISELSGLTVSDIDFVNESIRVERQLLRKSINHHMTDYIEDTKTDTGMRYVPMLDDTAECFARIIEQWKQSGNTLEIDGIRGFLFVRKNGEAVSALHWENYFESICKKYNKIHRVQIPNITPHICRHTFCTNMARRGMNPKTLQYIMGHSDISVTLNVYTHIGHTDALAEMKRVNKQ